MDQCTKLLLLVPAFCLLVMAPGVSRAEVRLEHLSTVYVPYTYVGSTAMYAYDKDAAEQSAYDPKTHLIYSVGTDLLHVIDVSKPNSPQIVHRMRISGGELTDVEVCNGYVAVAYDNKLNPLDGKVFVFDGYDENANTMKPLHSISVGALPDMVKFTNDCRRIVVAVEGELRMVKGHVVDPEGAVAIINFLDKVPSGRVSVKIANFTRFNDVAQIYVERGVRWVYHGQGTQNYTTFSQDLEPEYVAINNEGTVAYIILEENNAVATVDIEAGEVTEIYPLGSKPWHGLFMDASDRDGGINLESWPIYSLYQPDGATYIQLNGKGYLITANEGEEKEYEQPDFPFNFSDGRPGKFFVDNNLVDDEYVSADLKEALEDESKLGRLRLSTLDGFNNKTKKFTQFHAYGGRSFSLWDASNMSLVFDSRDDIERRIALHYPAVFSSNGQAKDGGPESSMDSRSHKKGPETETLDIGEVNGKTVLFVATERPGIVLIYEIPRDNPTFPVFQSVHYAGGDCKDWETLYKQRKTRDVDPEDIKFVSATDSPTGEPLLIISGTTSGTVSLYRVVDEPTCQSDISTQEL